MTIKHFEWCKGFVPRGGARLTSRVINRYLRCARHATPVSSRRGSGGADNLISNARRRSSLCHITALFPARRQGCQTATHSCAHTSRCEFRGHGEVSWYLRATSCLPGLAYHVVTPAHPSRFITVLPCDCVSGFDLHVHHVLGAARHRR